MVDTIHPANAIAGAPAYSGRQFRQVASAMKSGATVARPLGGLTGVRPGTDPLTVTATSTVWTCKPFAGTADVETAAEASVYEFAFDANATGAVTAAHATLARVDYIGVRVDDPAESDGSSVPVAVRVYKAGSPGSGIPPTADPRVFIIAWINVPASGGGSPTVTWKAPYTVAAGADRVAPDFTTLNLTPGSFVGERGRSLADGISYSWNGSAWVHPFPTYLGRLTATVSLVNNALTVVPDFTDVVNVGGFVETSGAVTVPVTGIYAIEVNPYAVSAGATHFVALLLNGSTSAERIAGAEGGQALNVSVIRKLTAGAVLRVQSYQNSGSTRTLSDIAGGATLPFLNIRYLGLA